MKVHEIRMVIDLGHGHGEAVCGCGQTFAWMAGTTTLVCPRCGASLVMRSPGKAPEPSSPRVRQAKRLAAADAPAGTALCTSCGATFMYDLFQETNMVWEGPRLELVCPHCGAT